MREAHLCPAYVPEAYICSPLILAGKRRLPSQLLLGEGRTFDRAVSRNVNGFRRPEFLHAHPPTIADVFLALQQNCLYHECSIRSLVHSSERKITTAKTVHKAASAEGTRACCAVAKGSLRQLILLTGPYQN